MYAFVISEKIIMWNIIHKKCIHIKSVCDNESHTSTAVNNRCSSRIGINSDPSVLFSRSHYEFIIIRATRVSSSRGIRKNGWEARRRAFRGKIRSNEPKRGWWFAGTTATRDGGDVWFFAGESQRHRENRPGEPRFPGTERYPVPSSANPRGWKTVARIWGTSGPPGSRFPDSYALLPIDLTRVRYIATFAS